MPGSIDVTFQKGIPHRLCLNINENFVVQGSFLEESFARHLGFYVNESAPIEFDSGVFNAWMTPTPPDTAGAPQLDLRRVIFAEFPDLVFLYLGKSSFSLTDLRGAQEFTDYSIIDLPLDAHFRPMTWLNRMIINAPIENTYAARFRSLQALTMSVSMYIPFIGGPLTDYHFHIVTRDFAPMLNKKIDRYYDNEKNVPTGHRLHTEHFFHVHFEDLEYHCVPGSRVILSGQLRWNIDLRVCEQSTAFEVASNLGYLPYRQVDTDKKGFFQISFVALHLSCGDIAKIVVKTKHNVTLGEVKVKII